MLLNIIIVLITSPSPTIILVNPQMGENIGAVARAMSNFGLSELRLVAPRDGWPNAKAYEMATENGKAILDSARLYASFTESLEGIQVAYATTARKRDMQKTFLMPDEAMRHVSEQVQQGAGVALVFGAERSGLANEELVYCDVAVCIPTRGANSSLNLAQSVVILGYEWVKTASSPLPRAGGEGGRERIFDSLEVDSPLNPPASGGAIATKTEWEGMFTQLEELLDDCNYFRTAQRKPLMWQGLRGIFLRYPLNSQEIRTLRGMLRSLSRQ